MYLTVYMHFVGTLKLYLLLKMHGMESFKTLSMLNTLFGVSERRD